ncbi:MAG: hypothetical protein JNK38_12710 [Acidobacteria bacterium]|nr:hypothetical protein [Acidobacteriota bacterium]
MNVMTYEAVVENGQVKLPYNAQLPEKARVYVVVPEMEVRQTIRLVSPHLAHPEQATYFEKEVVEGEIDAQI